ncbi:hypothetical protein HYALB_00005327 [Hymenoscyphus albidus]|uniref:Serine/threonine-protein kinase ppk6 n=1 Tax=Hymenoscyphus albidus TaxID=595503 RepID=A0A9N9M3F7_9HELO|nr:hypothetical protein HYALB_00005327 [Hymenoscyphus albidus]
MSADLLAEFDSFYQAPQDVRPNATPASNDLAFLGGTSSTQAVPAGAQWNAQPNQAAVSNGDIWGSMNSFQPSASNTKPSTIPAEDIWGDFAMAPTQQPPQNLNPSPANYAAATHTFQTRNDVGIVRRPTLDLFSSNVDTLQSIPHPQSTKFMSTTQKSLGNTTNSFSNDVLFDATEESAGMEDDDDDFGDFESVSASEPTPPQPVSPQSLDQLFSTTTLESKPPQRPKELSPTTIGINPLPYPQAPKSPSFRERNPFSGQLELAMGKAAAMKQADKPRSGSPITAWPTYVSPKPDLLEYKDSPAPVNEVDDDWGDFEDLPPEPPAVKNAKAISGIEANARGWDAADQVISTQKVDIPPPTNIPPPSVLLTLFPQLFDLPQSTLFKGVVNQPFSLKNRVLSDPATVDFLRGYLLIAIVAARVVAGRKLRWKRDTILSQAMKIGPAAAGGKGGMKLTGVDKAEITREDREAAEVVRVWKDQIGRLRSAIAVANTCIKDASRHLVIPEITETMNVKSLPGGLTAPKPCVICGLKREERIAKVDVQVEDSFGEWWTEHWGHRACKNVWERHESDLKHR